MPLTDALLVIAKRPAAGQTKTRLCPPLTAAQAAAHYECLLLDTLDLARRVAVPDLGRGILYLPHDAAPYFSALAPDFVLTPQVGASLGERLDHALADHFRRGFRRVAVLNSDGPTLPAAYVADAFARLAEGADVVFGPSADGGYYLIAATRPVPRLLLGVRMSAATTLADTLERARADGLRVALLPEWYDVDEPADLARLAREGAGGRTGAWLKGHA